MIDVKLYEMVREIRDNHRESALKAAIEYAKHSDEEDRVRYTIHQGVYDELCAVQLAIQNQETETPEE